MSDDNADAAVDKSRCCASCGIAESDDKKIEELNRLLSRSICCLVLPSAYEDSKCWFNDV